MRLCWSVLKRLLRGENKILVVHNRCAVNEPMYNVKFQQK